MPARSGKPILNSCINYDVLFNYGVIRLISGLFDGDRRIQTQLSPGYSIPSVILSFADKEAMRCRKRTKSQSGNGVAGGSAAIEANGAATPRADIEI